MNKYLSRKFIIAVLAILICVGAFIFSNSVKALSLIVIGVVAIGYIFAEMITDISETDMMEDLYEIKHPIGFKEENDE